VSPSAFDSRTFTIPSDTRSILLSKSYYPDPYSTKRSAFLVSVSSIIS
jgi:hypothetical protein